MMTLSPAPRADESLPDSNEPACDEAGLVRDTLGGNTRAFEELVRLHHRRVFNFLLQMTRQRQDAEDITQQTFIKAFNHLARFDPSRSLIGWLLTIARRTALNHFRDTKKWETIPEATASAGLSPAHSAEERDLAENMWATARATLSEREFEIMWLRFAEELTTEETARVVGLAQIHVKVLVHRARQTRLKGEKRP